MSEEISENIRNLRISYTQATLERVDPDPLKQLEAWLNAAIQAELVEPQAMTLGTVDAQGRPSSRVVLLRGLETKGGAEGLLFFSNYHSHKGHDLEGNPFACLNFFWGPLERQVRIEGRTEKLSAAESDAYFASRPRESQIASAASPQSQAIGSRGVLEEKMQALEAEFPDVIPRPEHWGGYRLIPDLFEFWQGRPARLHDRFQYRLEDSQGGGVWQVSRLAP